MASSFRETGTWPDEVSGGQGVTVAEIREFYHSLTQLVHSMCLPDSPKRCVISSLYVTAMDTAQTLRFAARNTAISRSEMRTQRPRRCAGSAPESMSRRTVRVDVLKSSAVSSIVLSVVRGRLCADLSEAGRCAGLTVR